MPLSGGVFIFRIVSRRFLYASTFAARMVRIFTCAGFVMPFGGRPRPTAVITPFCQSTPSTSDTTTTPLYASANSAGMVSTDGATSAFFSATATCCFSSFLPQAVNDTANKKQKTGNSNKNEKRIGEWVNRRIGERFPPLPPFLPFSVSVLLLTSDF